LKKKDLTTASTGQRYVTIRAIATLGKNRAIYALPIKQMLG